jgi:transposase-like protein
MAEARWKYTRDYKEAAVAMAERKDKTVGQTARELLGINASMLARWRSELR